MDNEQNRKLLASVEALIEAMQQSTTSGKDDAWRYSSYKEFARKYNQLLGEAVSIHGNIPVLDMYNLGEMFSNTNTIPVQQKSYFDSVHANLLILRNFLRNTLGTQNTEVINWRDFFQANLRRAMFTAPDNEKQVQDVVETLLIGRGLNKGVEYDRETGRVKVSSKETVPDFVMKHISLAIEIKLVKTKEKVKEVIDEINADIRAYSKAYSFLLFIIYDLGHIRDESEFKNDLDNGDNVNVIVVKH